MGIETGQQSLVHAMTGRGWRFQADEDHAARQGPGKT
jgi:hypothetical protein